MATELEGIKEVTEAILGIGEVAIDNFTFKVPTLSNYVKLFLAPKASPIPYKCKSHPRIMMLVARSQTHF